MDAIHPDRQTLERYSQAGASAAEERWIESHLRSGCRVCQREVDDLLSAMSSSPQDATAPDGVEESAFVQQGIFARLERRLAEVREERREAPPLVAELLGHAAPQRRLLVCQTGRFQTLAVCEMLIDACFEAGFRDAGEAVELAELSLLLTCQLDAGYYGASVVMDLRARAWAYLGNARRIAFDLAGAEEALLEAERQAEGGSADPLEEARIIDLRASLLGDQGRFEQAAELLDAAIDIYDDLREPHRKGRALISQGVLLGLAGGPEEAIRQLRKGLSLVDWEREPRLVLMARHNLAWFLNDSGRSEEALQQLERFLHTYGEFPDAWTELRLAWLSGRIASRLGYAAEAERTLDEARQRFLAEGHGYDASLVTLDLAELYLRQGRSAEVRELAASMISVFLSQDVHRQAAAALAVFQRAAELDEATPLLLEEIGTYLRRARRNPRLRFAGAAA
ncbi:MAG TPA: tetratricopeptide repeat protein [Thermoanaerobaculia bacterium]|jgi:tetratricopeptide (TPR) repeat protein|nr:tetratricopeptide repeat protein [Thermoanaerobaculia bacterium]